MSHRQPHHIKLYKSSYYFFEIIFNSLWFGPSGFFPSSIFFLDYILCFYFIHGFIYFCCCHWIHLQVCFICIIEFTSTHLLFYFSFQHSIALSGAIANCNFQDSYVIDHCNIDILKISTNHFYYKTLWFNLLENMVGLYYYIKTLQLLFMNILL